MQGSVAGVKRAALVVALLVSLAGTALAATPPQAPSRTAKPPSRPWIIDHASIEWLLAQGGWRSGLSNKENNPGFSVLGAGGELLFGIDVFPGLSVIADGRVMAGPRLGGAYLEGLGGVGLQLRVTDWVRIRGGAAAGQASLLRSNFVTDHAVLVGGWIAASVDLFRLLHDRAAAVISLRLDADGHVDPGATFSQESIELTLAVGFRF